MNEMCVYIQHISVITLNQLEALILGEKQFDLATPTRTLHIDLWSTAMTGIARYKCQLYSHDTYSG